jgi:uncharacterized phage protein (TIGR01671 family)
MYRAKSNKKWVYGDYYNNCDRGVNQSFIVCDNDQRGTGDHFIIDNSTLGICTGIKDKNNELIFEGDILIDREITEDGIDISSYYPVVYNVKSGSYCIDNSYYNDNQNLVNMVEYFGLENLEIVGNIFDNKNLLPQRNSPNFENVKTDLPF